jgi:hypothetical protein
MIIDEESPFRDPGEDAPQDLVHPDLARLAGGAAVPADPAGRAPRECGHFDIHIAPDGSWFYRGTPIKRPSLVRLFGSVLHRDAAGTFWLVTPAERGRITVADAPFLAVELAVRGRGREQTLILRTNVGDTVAIDDAHPLRIVTNDATREPRPYVRVRNGLEARLTRPVFYELVALGREERVGGTALYGVWSNRRFFPLGRLDQTD